MKLDFEDALVHLDHNHDFETFYSKINIIKDHLSDLVITLIPIRQLSSGYHYVTAALENFTSLQRLTVTTSKVATIT